MDNLTRTIPDENSINPLRDCQTSIIFESQFQAPCRVCNKTTEWDTASVLIDASGSAIVEIDCVKCGCRVIQQMVASQWKLEMVLTDAPRSSEILPGLNPNLTGRE